MTYHVRRRHIANRFREIVIFLSLAIGVQGATVDIVVGSGGSVFQTATAAGRNAGTFYSVTSSDGRNCNIGYYMAGTAVGSGGTPCGNQPGGVDRMRTSDGANYLGPGVNEQYWGTNATTNDSNFYINPASPTYTITLVAAAAGNASTNQIGIYLVSNPDTRIVLLNGLTPTIGTTIQFTPGATGGVENQFGFYAVTSAGTFFSQSSLNTGDTSQHFAVFRTGTSSTLTPQRLTQGNSGWSTLYVGMEDSRFGGGADGDYNDAIFKMTCVLGSCGSGPPPNEPPMELAPEPAQTSFLVFSALAMIYLWKFRLRRR